MLMPLDFLWRWLSGLLTLVFLGGAGYILYQWYEGELVSNRWLLLGAINGCYGHFWLFCQFYYCIVLVKMNPNPLVVGEVNA